MTTPRTVSGHIDPGVLIVRLCRSSRVGQALDEHLMALADERFLAEFRECAARERVLGLILERIAASPHFPRLPSMTRDVLGSELRRLRHQGAFWDLQSEQLILALSASNCEPVLLKGGALRRTVYRGPADRPVADLDILVRRQLVEPTVVALGELGYQIHPSEAMREAYEEHHFHLVLRNPRGFIVEVHWDLTSPHSAYRFDPTEFIEQAVAIEQPRGGVAWIPRPELTFLHIISQLAIEYPYVGRLVDLDRLIRAPGSFEWEFLIDRAARYGLTNPLALWLTVLQHVLETPVPPPVGGLANRVSKLARLHLAVLDVPSFMTSPRRRSPEALVALRLWQGPDGTHLRHFLELVGRRGQLDDEAVATMLGDDARARSAHFVSRHYRGLKGVTKLVAYQVWLYVRALHAVAVSPRRSPFALWSTAP